jgi:hypothetical protein
LRCGVGGLEQLPEFEELVEIIVRRLGFSKKLQELVDLAEERRSGRLPNSSSRAPRN